MNPLTNMKNVSKLSENELGISDRPSWHDQYKDSAWVFVGGLPYTYTEGDIICIFSEFGEIVHMRLVRHRDTGKSQGYGYICYEDQRSTTLAVDNLNGIKLMNRPIRVDHVAKFRVPKEELDKVKKQAEQAAVEKIEAEELGRSTAAGHPLKRELQDGASGERKLKKAKKEKKSKKAKKEKKKKRKRKHSSTSNDTSDA